MILQKCKNSKIFASHDPRQTTATCRNQNYFYICHLAIQVFLFQVCEVLKQVKTSAYLLKFKTSAYLLKFSFPLDKEILLICNAVNQILRLFKPTRPKICYTLKLIFELYLVFCYFQSTQQHIVLTTITRIYHNCCKVFVRLITKERTRARYKTFYSCILNIANFFFSKTDDFVEFSK